MYNKSIFIYLIFSHLLFAQVKMSIKTIPGQARVVLDGIIMGNSPIINERIYPGEHKFEIVKEGYAPLKYELNVNQAQAIHLDFFLNPIYMVQFKTKEIGLVFQLNNVHLWDEDEIRLQLEAGEHFLRVFKLGEIIDEQKIIVDQPKKFSYSLKSLNENN
tara:strand:- start:1407 stop:1886 length:480 start_codon:yes stop_codon:yes gene_type:complete